MAGPFLQTLSYGKPVSEKPRNKWQNGRSRWPVCLDTATLNKKLSIEEKIILAANAGFDCIEPWDGELEAFEKKGGSLKDLGQRIKDLGLYVPSVIGLWSGMDVSREKFKERLEEHRNRLRIVSEIGSQNIQVVPNFKEGDMFDPKIASWCYGQVLDMAKTDYGMGAGVVFLNFFPGLSTLHQAKEIAEGSGRRDAAIIPDTFHMYLGRSDFSELGQLKGDFITIFQFADCPAGIKPHGRKDDAVRVLPGDGVLPLEDALYQLRKINYRGPVSLELYNPELRAREPVGFLEEALEKTVAVCEKASV
jgi:2-keto-myo-inositol isomerase